MAAEDPEVFVDWQPDSDSDDEGESTGRAARLARAAKNFDPQPMPYEWFLHEDPRDEKQLVHVISHRGHLLAARGDWAGVLRVWETQATQHRLGRLLEKSWLDLRIQAARHGFGDIHVLDLLREQAMADTGFEYYGRLMLAETLLDMGRHEEALSLLMICIDAQRISGRLWGMLADCYWALRDQAQLKRCYAQMAAVRARAWAELGLQSSRGFGRQNARAYLERCEARCIAFGLPQARPSKDLANAVFTELKVAGVTVELDRAEDEPQMHKEQVPQKGLVHEHPDKFEAFWFHRWQYLPQTEADIPEPRMAYQPDRGALATSASSLQ